MVTLVKPESSSIFCQPARGSPPAIQAAHRSISRRASGGTGRPLATSANCSAPPGRSTRWISASTVLLSAQRLIAPFEDDDVGPAVFDGQGLGQAFAELDLLQPQRVQALALDFATISGVMSMPITWPWSPTCRAATKASKRRLSRRPRLSRRA